MSKEATSSDSNSHNTFEMNNDVLNLIAEFGKVTMAQCANTLSSILEKDVKITGADVEYIPFKTVLEDLRIPKISSVVEFKEGLKGISMLLLNESDAIIIADLMTDGTGNPLNDEFTEMEISAISEAINQMIGSSTTSIATMIGKKVDIFQPKVNLWKNESEVDYKEIGLETLVSRVTFRFYVEGVIDSEISQIFSTEMIADIAQLMLQNAKEESSDSMPEKQTEEQVGKKRKQRTRKVTIQQPEFEELEEEKVELTSDNLDLLMDVPLDFSVVLGSSRKSIKDILTLGVGSVVELDKLTDEPLDIYVNSKLIAKGEVVVINENFGIRITSILSQKQRINNLN